jgi:hypothetical protein
MRLTFAFLLWLAAVPGAAAADTATDLELVLAVDASGSVDDDEFVLQLEGIAASFRDPEVVQAIGRGPARSIAVNMVLWAEHNVPKEMTGWFVIASPADGERFARVVVAFPRGVTGATGMGEGLAAALRSLDGNGIQSPRQVVDVSGDGSETPARDYVVMMPQARVMAYSRAVTVNGLAIVGSEPGLEQWYRDHVLTGRGSFLEIAKDYGDFARAMRRKLLQEIERLPRLSLN